MWCSRCGAKLQEGTQFCEVCGTAVDSANKTFVLQNPNDMGGASSNIPQYNFNNDAPVVPQYGPNDYIENKSATVTKSKTGYIIIIIICIVVVLASTGLILWTLLGNSGSSGGKKHPTRVEDDDDDEDEDEDEDEDGDDMILSDPVPVDGDDAPEYAPAVPEDDSDDSTYDADAERREAEERAAAEREAAEREAAEREAKLNRFSYELRDKVSEDYLLGDYILEGSDSRRISESELYGLTELECKLAMNELYARHGRLFDTPEIQEYFNSKDWYYGNITASDWQNGKYDARYFSEVEIENRDIIAEYQKDMGWRK